MYAIGSRMIGLLVDTQDIEQTIQTLHQEYDTKEERIRKDVTELLTELKRNGLVETDVV